jgi:hypothetical protein
MNPIAMSALLKAILVPLATRCSTGSVISATPDANALPGTAVVQNLINGGEFWALLACLAVLFGGSVAWAFGNMGGNVQSAAYGKRGVIFGGLAALVIGAGPYLINFFLAAGQGACQ